jgi:hypothetical protein
MREEGPDVGYAAPWHNAATSSRRAQDLSRPEEAVLPFFEEEGWG